MLMKLYSPLFPSDYQETFGDKAEVIVSELYVTQICSFKQQSLSHTSRLLHQVRDTVQKRIDRALSHLFLLVAIFSAKLTLLLTILSLELSLLVLAFAFRCTSALACRLGSVRRGIVQRGVNKRVDSGILRNTAYA